MFAYNPTVNDESGAIRGQGIVNSAQMNAQAKMKLADDIGSALVSVAGAFGEAGELAQQGDSAYEALGAIGEMYPGMKSTYGALGKMDPRTRRMASMSILDNLGAVSQMGIAGMREQMAPVMQAQRVTDQRDIMYEREQLARERQAMSTPPAPAAVTVPPAMRRFGP
jgi:hypothetical protein